MPKLTKKNPNFYRIIGKKGGKARKESGADYSAMAASSHGNRVSYNGGRPRGSKTKPRLVINLADRLPNGRIAPLPDMTGRTVGRLLVIGRFEKTKKYGWKYECKCTCGNTAYVLGANLSRIGGTESCGCLLKESIGKLARSHGLSKTTQYKSWSGMHDRCKREGTKDSHRYVGRGISVCDRWQTFELFWEDMGQTWAAGLTIDRINNDGDYEPGNCRWATRSTQAFNRGPKSGWIKSKVKEEDVPAIIDSLRKGESATKIGVKCGVVADTIRKVGWQFAPEVMEARLIASNHPKKKLAKTEEPQ